MSGGVQSALCITDCERVVLMDPNDYVGAWVVYLVAALVLSVLAWRLFSRFLPRLLAWLLECWLLALLLTPWYVLEDQKILAPAFIVFALDTITVEPLAGIRALTPLVLALLAAALVAVLLSVVERVWRSARMASAPAPVLGPARSPLHNAYLPDTPYQPDSAAEAGAETQGSIGPLLKEAASPAPLPEIAPEPAAHSAVQPAKARAPRKRRQPAVTPEAKNTAAPAVPRRRRKAKPEAEAE